MRNKFGRFVKGNKPTHGFKRGHPPTKGSFKKGRISLNKGKFGENHPSWKGGMPKSHGRFFVYAPNHPFNRKKYVLRSRFVMEQYLGRYLKPEEVVHHINGNIFDDRKENLQLFNNNGKHIKFHILLRK